MLRIIVQIPLSTVRCSVSRMFSACVCPFCRKVLKKFADLEKVRIFAILFETTGLFGSIAQLVQSVCLTSRGSGVRLPLLPPKRLGIHFRVVLHINTKSKTM